MPHPVIHPVMHEGPSGQTGVAQPVTSLGGGIRSIGVQLQSNARVTGNFCCRSKEPTICGHEYFS
jgi:hypothetical protein